MSLSGENAATGRCLCGSFHFVAHGEPLTCVYCHCVDCRISSGAPVSALVGYDAEKVEYTGDEPKKYQSSETVTRAFCGTCGGTVSYEDELLPGEIYLHAGLFDEPDRLAPTVHSWHSQAVSWLSIDDGLPRHEKSSKPR
ncbi:GFA family protein [Rubrobacter aplysinae]|uniref:GFA family protein n=1 Tax=Rubrobacter aplysinae TaxID=909625 RepID=UPI00064C36EA|nr:GFA family protein [Rubrobacter aplysinae]